MVERFLQLRKTLGLSQEEFSSKLGISRSGYSDIEHRRTPAQERHIRLILSAFPKVSESWLRTGSGSMFNETDPSITDVVNAYDFPDIVRIMLEAFDELDDETKESVTTYTRDFLAKVYENYHGTDADPAADDDLQQGHLEKVRVPVKIRFTWHESTSRRDLDNIFSAKKFILDALQNMGVLDGDGQKYVKGLSDEFILDKVEEFIMVELEVAI